jgi:arylsulfatase A-like enzyme
MFRNRLVSRIVWVVIVGAALAAFWTWRNRLDSVMEVTVRLTAENGVAEVRSEEVAFGMHQRKRPLATVEMDLARWTGNLVRLEVGGKLRARRGFGGPRGFVGCSASVTDGARERPIEFVGWENEGEERVHIGRLGPGSFRGPERDGRLFVYAREDRLWHVISVQGQERLKLYFTPVLPADLDHPDEPYLPSAPPPWRPPRGAPQAGAGRTPDVFIYLIDALRPDHLGCYGYGRPTSPTIDRFAAAAVVHEHAQAAATWTRPSVASLLTGLYPMAHGVVHMDSDKLDDWPVTMAEALRAAGYRTLHVSTNGHVSGHYGFLDGVDGYSFKNVQTAEWANQQAAALLEGEDPDQPVFMYVHVIGPHDPYAPKAATFQLFDRGFGGERGGPEAATSQAPNRHSDLSPEELQHLLDRYDAEIRDSDADFAEFLDLLRQTGRFENSLIIVLADHGESFSEHDTLRHGTTLNAEEMRVPLIIRYPGKQHAGARVKARSSLVDVYPTVMAATGVDPRLSYALPGRDLAALAATSSPGSEVPIFAELSTYSNNKLDLVALIDEHGYKRVCDMSVEPGARARRSSIGLWDTRRDPRESVDLSDSLPVRAAYDEMLLGRYLVVQRWWRGPASTGTTASAPLTPAMRRQLQAMGYLK